MCVDQLKDAFAASLDVALQRGHLAKLIRSHTLGKTGPGTDSRIENFTMRHAHLAASVRTKNETVACKFKSNLEWFAWQISEAQGSELSGNLFALIDPAHKLA